MGIFSDYTGEKNARKEKPTKMSKMAKWIVLGQFVIYVALIFVVIYGMGKMIYSGFPGWVPILIMALFAYMAYRRLSTYLRLTRDQRTGKDKIYDELFADDEDDESYYNNYFK